MRKLVMSSGEIVSSFRQAKRPNDQIGVLADLNACTKQDILDVLTEEGAISGVTPPGKRPVAGQMPTNEGVQKRVRIEWTVEMEKDLIRFYEEGLTSSQISERMGIDARVVANRLGKLKRAGYLFPRVEQPAKPAADHLREATKKVDPEEKMDNLAMSSSCDMEKRLEELQSSLVEARILQGKYLQEIEQLKECVVRLSMLQFGIGQQEGHKWSRLERC